MIITILVLPHTVPAGEMDRFLDIRFEEGEKAINSGELQRAYEIFTDLLKKEPGNERINFAYGMTCFALKDYSRARLAFERVLYINRGNDRARLELARTYLASGQLDLAKEQFELVLTRNPPESVQKNIQAYLEQIKRGTKRWSFSTRVDLGAFMDDNVNVGPDSKIINIAPIIYGASTISSLTIGETSLPVDTEGAFCSVALSGAYDTGEQGEWVITTDGSYYQNWLDNAYEHESLYGQVAVGLRHTGRRSMLKLPLTVAHISSGHDSLVNLYGISPSHLYVYGDKGEVRWQTDGSLEYRDYDELDDRDSFYFSVGEKMTHYFSPQKHSVSMGVSLFHDHTDTGIYENTGGEWTLGGEFNLPWKCTLYAEVSYTTSDYAERETLAPEERTDTQHQFTGGLTKTINASWGLDVNYQTTDNNSTYGLYQYDRNVTTISTFCSF